MNKGASDECYKCGEGGHFVRDCKKEENQQIVPEQQKTIVLFMMYLSLQVNYLCMIKGG